MSTKRFMTATGSNRELRVSSSGENVAIEQYDAEFDTCKSKTFFLTPSNATKLAPSILEEAGVSHQRSEGKPHCDSDALEAAQNALSVHHEDQKGLRVHYTTAVKIAVSAYLAVAQPVVTGEQINRAGWTCDGIHEPGSYATCEDCRGACDDLASFYNQMRITPNASGPWTYRPEVKG